MKPLTYLLVDFENLQPPAEDIALVRGEDRRLLIFHGPHQNKFSAEMLVAGNRSGNMHGLFRVRSLARTHSISTLRFACLAYMLLLIMLCLAHKIQDRLARSRRVL